DHKGFRLNHAWLKKFGVTNGTTAEDWIDDELTREKMIPYFWPSDSEQEEAGVRAVFLGHYFRWDPEESYRVALKHGFQSIETPKTGYYAYADIDDEFLITIHHWMKWYKFGFTRLWDNLSLEVRNGRMSRDDAVDLIRNAGPEQPDEEIDQFCQYLGIDRKHFFEIAEKFRNTEIWKKDSHGNWYIPDFLISDWSWS
ncbi:MAG: N-acetyl sugar amidotransferase, partial [Candidatus Competibacteraceae bacterium]|nr:N-acetyl sugar amidotransferase [Candidatus Competibacteraceae bacterium]